ncbi:hypothetical protein [Robertkochia solimangrovi]|uniref:hypothetical protein n=1 Tax=Robertkochia solimangrovi TaxID=2213046 RepID=UPI001181578F|nr:hypothetical protein [Robertkochia solimangrovi]TRZ45313.1 hypothetical protein DMZ48_06085 [Robertkochia solimangrovi]
MLRYLLGICIAITTVSCYNAQSDCKNFKTGEFQFNYTLDGREVETTFIRNDSMEYDIIDGKTDTNTVRWINDCEFIVKKINPQTISEGKAIHIKILTTSKNSYTFEYSLVGDTKNKQKGVAHKIN